MHIDQTFKQLHSKKKKGLKNSQVKLLVPHWVQLLRHGARAFFDLAHLHGDVGVGGAAFVLGDQSLSANDCGGTEAAVSTRFGGQPQFFKSARRNAFAKKERFSLSHNKKGQSVSPPSLYISAVSDAAVKSCLRKKMMEHEWEVINLVAGAEDFCSRKTVSP